MRKLLFLLGLTAIAFTDLAQTPNVTTNPLTGHKYEFYNFAQIDSAAFFGKNDTSWKPTRSNAMIFDSVHSVYAFWFGGAWHNNLGTTVTLATALAAGNTAANNINLQSGGLTTVSLNPGGTPSVYIADAGAYPGTININRKYIDEWPYLSPADYHLYWPYFNTVTESEADDTLTTSGITRALYQPTLVSATNIKTINGLSVLGSGNLAIAAGGGHTYLAGWGLKYHDAGDTTFDADTTNGYLTTSQFKGDTTIVGTDSYGDPTHDIFPTTMKIKTGMATILDAVDGSRMGGSYPSAMSHRIDSLLNISPNIRNVIIETALNDVGVTPIGILDDPDTSTFMGAIGKIQRSVFHYDSIHSVAVKLIFITAVRKGTDSTLYPLQKSYDDAEKVQAQRHGSFVIDQFNRSGITYENFAQCSHDGIHVDQPFGKKLYCDALVGALLAGGTDYNCTTDSLNGTYIVGGAGNTVTGKGTKTNPYTVTAASVGGSGWPTYGGAPISDDLSFIGTSTPYNVNIKANGGLVNYSNRGGGSHITDSSAIGLTIYGDQSGGFNNNDFCVINPSGINTGVYNVLTVLSAGGAPAVQVSNGGLFTANIIYSVNGLRNTTTLHLGDESGTNVDLRANGTDLVDHGTTGDISVGGSADSVSAVLQVNSTTQGFATPRMTTTQRTSISSPMEGLEVYDLTLHHKFYFNGTIWVSL